ncbi:MAG: hypothetical protein LRY36_02370 [Alphaproteobacteria bacterium]|nr:hypothetical protein [Alphaproteobacteria bacterium]
MKYLNFIAVLMPVLVVACSGDTAPERPKLPYTISYANEGFQMARAPQSDEKGYGSRTFTADEISHIEPAAGSGFIRDDSYQAEDIQRRTALQSDKIPSGCSIKDRFDRSETIAYQWGQNRLGFTANMDGTDFKGGFLRYRLKFQPHQTSKERCKYKSAWQGLVGSSYNEFFLRENNTVWDDLKALRLDAQSRIDTLLQR